MSAETANLLRMELETSDRLRGYWQDTQKKLNAAIRERDEAIKERADAVRLLRIYKGAITPLEGEGDVEDQLANCRVQLDEAQAELARVRADCLRRHNDAVDSYEEVLALRAAIEAHNKKCRYYQHPDMLIPLPPAAAPSREAMGYERVRCDRCGAEYRYARGHRDGDLCETQLNPDVSECMGTLRAVEQQSPTQGDL